MQENDASHVEVRPFLEIEGAEDVWVHKPRGDESARPLMSESDPHQDVEVQPCAE